MTGVLHQVGRAQQVGRASRPSWIDDVTRDARARTMTGGTPVPPAAPLIAACALALCGIGCDAPPVDDVDAGPPAPDRFATTECTTTTTNPAAEVTAGVGFAEFDEAAEEKIMPVVDVDGLSYAYFSVRVRFTRLSDVCLQYRLDIAEPDEPNEALAFDRYLLDLEPDPAGGGIVRGIAAQVEDPQAVSGKRVLLVLDVADGTVSGSTNAFATLE